MAQGEVQSTALAEDEVRADPSKEFFIDMITRDIDLREAVMDLIDNSVDGARRVKQAGKRPDYSGLGIQIRIVPEKLTISDNCGGIEVEVARNYAFRFGRDEDAPATPNSIGRFGIGMKRSLFKLGNKFKVSSVAPTSRFELTVDVEEWKRQAGPWRFRFDSYSTGEDNDWENTRTTVEAWDLHETVSNDFAQGGFLTKLVESVREALQGPVSEGFNAEINEHQLRRDPATLLSSGELSPHFEKLEHGGVTVRIYAGVDKPDLDGAGWYVFCNDRLVIQADQTYLTGWGETSPVRVPKFHNQFHRFKGYVYFDAEDAELLPWKTTKDGVNADSRIWRATRQRMVQIMRPIIEMLNDLRNEDKGKVPHKVVTQAYKAADVIKVADIEEAVDFSYPEPPPATGPKMIQIKYHRKVEEVEDALEYFNVKRAGDAGQRTFEFWKRHKDLR